MMVVAIDWLIVASAICWANGVAAICWAIVVARVLATSVAQVAV